MNYEDIRRFFGHDVSESKTCEYAPDDYFWRETLDYCYDAFSRALRDQDRYNDFEVEEKPKETETKFQAIFCD